MFTTDLYWEIESLYSGGSNPKQIAEQLKCDIQIVYEVLKDLGEDYGPKRPRRGKVHARLRDNEGY